MLETPLAFEESRRKIVKQQMQTRLHLHADWFLMVLADSENSQWLDFDDDAFFGR
jgi:hypothetical protein